MLLVLKEKNLDGSTRVGDHGDQGGTDAATITGELQADAGGTVLAQDIGQSIHHTVGEVRVLLKDRSINTDGGDLVGVIQLHRGTVSLVEKGSAGSGGHGGGTLADGVDQLKDTGAVLCSQALDTERSLEDTVDGRVAGIVVGLDGRHEQGFEGQAGLEGLGDLAAEELKDGVLLDQVDKGEADKLTHVKTRDHLLKLLESWDEGDGIDLLVVLGLGEVLSLAHGVPLGVEDHLVAGGAVVLGDLGGALDVGGVGAGGEDDSNLGRGRDVGVRDEGADGVVDDGRDGDGEVLASETALEQVLEVLAHNIGEIESLAHGQDLSAVNGSLPIFFFFD